mmetsp:Transcript_18701/g.32472  ORF Transcript_18701/g.32472 Transcript_18701/m.32472 type:complete len:189 (+) Transcript_18701:990-1556(+)
MDMSSFLVGFWNLCSPVVQRNAATSPPMSNWKSVTVVKSGKTLRSFLLKMLNAMLAAYQERMYTPRSAVDARDFCFDSSSEPAGDADICSGEHLLGWTAIGRGSLAVAAGRGETHTLDGSSEHDLVLEEFSRREDATEELTNAAAMVVNTFSFPDRVSDKIKCCVIEWCKYDLSIEERLVQLEMAHTE